MRRTRITLTVLIAFWLTGCTAAQETMKKGGEAIGKGANVVGGLSEGGAEAIQGPVTNEENPYGR